MGYIVSHLGMNLDQRLKEFKQFEKDDQAFWEKVIGGEEPEVSASVRAGNTRLSAAESPVIVSGEIADSLWEEDFASLEDQQIVAELRDRLESLGLNPNDADELVRKSKPGGLTKRPGTESFPIQPQRELEEMRKRVYEQARRIAKILLNHVKLDEYGTEIPYKYTSLSIVGKNNYIAAVMMVNHEIKKRLGKKRDQCSVEDFKGILNSLDNIVQTLARRIRKAKKTYEQQET